METSTAIILFFIIPLFLYYLKRKITLKTLNIPGPKSLPLIGNTHQLDPTGAHKTFIEWGKKFGGIFKIKLFNTNVVVVNDADLIYEVLVTKSSDFGGRMPCKRLDIIIGNAQDVVTRSITTRWATRKKMLMKSLRQFGEKSDTLELISHQSIERLKSRIETEGGCYEGIDLKPLLHKCIAEIITSIMYGRHFKDQELEELLKIERPLLEASMPTSPSAIIDIFPSLQYVPIGVIKKLFKDAETLQNWFKNKEDEIKKVACLDNPSCMFEDLLLYQKTHGNFDDAEIRGVCINTVFGGFVTTTTTLYALFAILSTHPVIQNNIRREIKHIIGNRKPCLQDRSSMPYTEAVLLELLRYTSISPVLFPHTASKNTTLGGYDIPVGTAIMPNAWCLHLNEKLWDEPFKFKPKRFLTLEGDLVGPEHQNRRNLLPFGAGRRICAGENLARNRMFLIVTSLIQTFQFLPEDPQNPPEHDPRTYVVGILMHPKMYKIKLEKVKEETEEPRLPLSPHGV